MYRKKHQKIKTLFRAMLAISLLWSQTAYALPQNGTAAAGSSTITQPDASTMHINQTTDKSIINWQGYSIGANEKVQYFQPSSSSISLNRVTGADPSLIYGQLSANGQVWVINPNGMLIGQNAKINVGGFLASTLNINDNDFINGNYQFRQEAIGNRLSAITNQGSINAADGGYVAFISPTINNSGNITANNGSVNMASGDDVTLTFANNGLINLVINKQTAAEALGIDNSGAITADGGQVIISAQVAGDLLKTIINNTGVIQARTIESKNGVIKLLGGMENNAINVGGTLDASAPNSGDGGFIETSAASVKINDNAKITTYAPNGKTGTWLIDPQDYTIASSGGDITGSTLSANLGSNNVTILSSSGGAAGNGDINVNDAVSWSANLLTLTAARDININAIMTASGTSRLAMNTATANGADGAVAGGAVKVGLNAGGFTGRVDFPGRGGAGFLTINGNDYTIIQTIGAGEGDVGQETLQGMNGRLDWNYALGSNIDAYATSGLDSGWDTVAGFMPVGTSATPFTGRFNGLGHTVSNLTINRAGTNYVGLFGTSSGDVRNVGITGGSIGGNGYVGALVGDNNGTVSNVYASATVTGANDMVGGLVGRSGSVVANSFATGSVSGNDSVGGLVGFSVGTISNSYSTGNVSGTNWHIGGLVGFNAFGATTMGSHASGAVTADNIGQRYIGGLAGQNDGTITNSYSTAEVQAYSYAGGLVGYNDGTISGSYSDGIVTASYQFAGGLAGYNDMGANINTSYNTGYVRAYEYAGGLAGWSDGSIAVSYNTGPVNGAGTGSQNIGGLVGYNTGTIANAYNTGSVTGDQRIGGLVGALDGTGSITNAYNAGTVTGSSFTGGLVGRYWAGTVTDSYWDTTTSGQAASTGGGTGLTTAQMKQQASFTGWDFTNTWIIYDGVSYPTLQVFWTPPPSSDNTWLGLLDNYWTTIGNWSLGHVPTVAETVIIPDVAGTAFIQMADGTFTVKSVTSAELFMLTGSGTSFTLTQDGAFNAGLSLGAGASLTSQGTLSMSSYTLGNGAKINLNQSGAGILTIAGAAYIVINDVNALQNMSGSLAGKYALGSDIDASATSSWNSGAGFAPVGNLTTRFTGILEGFNHTITGLTINRPSQSYIGLFGYTNNSSCEIRNVGLVDGSITGSWDTGGLVGYNNFGTITDSYSTGSITGSGSDVGGLVGYNNGGTIADSYSTGSVTGGSDVGGLVGTNDSGTIRSSYSTGAVSGDWSVGGLVGMNYGTIRNSYATGSVNGGTNSAGGLAGYNGGTIAKSYATGSVSGGSYVGGLVGYNNGGTITKSYWDMETSGQTTSAGGTGMTTADMKILSNFTGATAANENINPNWDFTTDWRIYEGYTYPLLKSFLTPLTVTADNVTKTYDGTAWTTTLQNVNYGGADTSKIFNLNTPYGASSGKNVASYTPQLYSTQQGYDISYVGGVLTIAAASTGGTTTTVDYTDVIHEGLGNFGGIALNEPASQDAKFEGVYVYTDSSIFTYTETGISPLITDYQPLNKSKRLCFK